MKKYLSFILSVIISVSAIASCWNVSAVDISDSDDVLGKNTTPEIEATNSVGKLLVDAIDENEDDFEPNGCYNVEDLNLNTLSGEINVELSVADYCNLIVSFYNNDGTELITFVTQEIQPESESAVLNIDMALLPENFLIKAFLLDYDQLPLCDSYVCNDYTEAKQAILDATVYDFDEEYVVNLDSDTTTNFFVLNSDTTIITSSETENLLVSADFENGIYIYSNPGENLTSLQNGDLFYNQSGNTIVVDKVGSITVDGNTVTIVSSGTDLQEAFDFIKIESDSSDFDILEIDESVEENAELISYGRTNSSSEEQNVLNLFSPSNKTGEAPFWDSFTFTFTLGEDELYGDKSDDADDLKYSESIKASGTVDVVLDPHINCYWNLWDSYFEINFEFVTNITFDVTLTGAYTGQICKLCEIAVGGIGIYFKITPTVEVSVKVELTLNATSTETFGFHYDTNTGYRSLQKSPDITTNGLDCSGEISLYINFQPKLIVITEKAANITLNAKAGVKITAKTNSLFSDLFGNNTEMHECDSCISGKICIFVELSIVGSALNDRFKLKKDILDLTIPISDYHISETFGEFELTECPHYKYKLEFKILNEKRQPVSDATITLTKPPIKILQLAGITEPIIDTLTTNSDGCAEIWYPKSYSSNTPITITISADGYDTRSIQYKFTGKSRKFNLYIFPEGYIGEKFADFVSLFENTIDENITTTTTTTTTTTSGNIVASGECGADGDNLTWTLDDAGTLIISGAGDMKDWGWLTTPWYSFSSDIVNVIIRDGVTSIGDSAFEDCSGLTSITIPDSVSTIGDFAFAWCGLISATISKNVSCIGRAAFSGTPWLSDKQEESALVIVNNILIDGSTCEGNIAVPDYVISISGLAFSGCEDLTSIILPDNLISIGDSAFTGCKNLTSITLPDNLISIGDSAFTDCKNLTSITLPDNLISIGDFAFNATGLTSITIPDNVTTIGRAAFLNCSSMETINVDINNDYYSSENGILFDKDKSTLYCYPKVKSEKEYIVPISVKNIEECAFCDCSNLTSIILHDNIITIGEDAFNGSGLISIALPNSVTSIAPSLFCNCYYLTSITIPNSVTAINYFAFAACYKLIDVYYTGTEEEWNAITIGSYNNSLTNATIHYNSASSYEVSLASALSLNAVNIQAAESTESTVKTYTYSGAVPDTSYLLLAVNSAEAENILSADNLLYINQQTADESGIVTFNYIAPDDCTYIFIGDFGKGEYCRIVGSSISTDTEQCTICGSSNVRIYVKDVTTEVGYYFSHDYREFNKGQVSFLDMVSVALDDNGDPIEGSETPIDLDMTKINFNGQNPQDTYREENITFKYDDIQAYYDDIALVYEDGTPVTVTAYIGVKGDVDLDNRVMPTDATALLVYYSYYSMNDIRTLCPRTDIEVTEELDNLAALLGDADTDEFSEDNWKLTKTERNLSPVDATFILMYYSYHSMMPENHDTPWVIWNMVVPDRIIMPLVMLQSMNWMEIPQVLRSRQMNFNFQ